LSVKADLGQTWGRGPLPPTSSEYFSRGGKGGGGGKPEKKTLFVRGLVKLQPRVRGPKGKGPSPKKKNK